jgi:hypothetical protein
MLVQVQYIGLVSGKKGGDGGYKAGLIRTMHKQDGGGCHFVEYIEL